MKYIHIIPLFMLILSFILFYYFQVYRYMNIDILMQYHQILLTWKLDHYFLTIILYMIIYTFLTASSIPGMFLLTMIGGFLFGIQLGMLVTVTSIVTGSLLLFFSVQGVFKRVHIKKVKYAQKQFQTKFKKNVFYYLLALRIIPIFPLGPLTIISALFNVRLFTFIIATFFGVIPSTLIYSSFGNSIHLMIAMGKTPHFTMIFNPSIYIPIFGFVLLILLSIIYKKHK